MGKGFQTSFFLILCLFFIQNYKSQRNPSFCGELVYAIERVDKKDSIKAEMIIYARDSLIRVVNFNSQTGRQELIKHLRLGKSYVLLETPKQNFAVRTNEHMEKDTLEKYTFKKSFSFKRVAGLLTRKIIVKQRAIKNELAFYVYNKISAKYANAYINLPGLPVVYYIPTENGLYKYTLLSLKETDPPLQIFTFGKDYKVVSFDEFSKEFSRLYESGE